jgi:hypothetical protein
MEFSKSFVGNIAPEIAALLCLSLSLISFLISESSLQLFDWMAMLLHLLQAFQ